MKKKKVRRIMAGGKVSGPGTKTSDSILARLSKGEYVLPAESVAQVGLPTLEALRQQGLRARAGAPPGYAMGGFVSDSQMMEARAKADPLDVASGRFDRENPMMRGMNAGMQPGLPRAGFFSEQTNPAMDAYRQARSGADPLDVASGRFDRENPLSGMAQGGLPRFAEGGMVGQAEWNWLPRFADGGSIGSLFRLVDEPYRRWRESQQAAEAARQAAATSQKRIPLRGGGHTMGIESPAEILPQKTAAIPSPGLSTTPPLRSEIPRGQFELPSMPSGPASKAPIPFEVRPPAPQALALEPKGLPLPNEIPYTPPRQTGLSLANGNVIDYQAQPTPRQYANVQKPMTPSQIAALQQQAELAAKRSGISPQAAIKNMEVAMRLEPIEKQPMQARPPVKPVGRMSASSMAGRTLPLAGENIVPALGMGANIVHNAFSGMGLSDAIKLGYDQARFDEMTSEGRKQYFNDVRPTAPKPAASTAPSAVVPQASPTAPGTPSPTGAYFGPDEEWARPSGESAIGKWWRGGSVAQNYEKYSPVPQRQPMEERWSSLTAPSAAVPQARPTAPSEPSPTGAYQDPRDYSVQNPGASGGAMRASGADQLPGTDIYRRTTADPGNWGATTYTPLGVSAPGGGQGTATFQGLPKPGGFVGYAGTPETAQMNQEQATAYNVANLNRQIEAMQSLREAQNPGITTGQAGRAFGDVVSFGTPGGNYGDEAMQRQKVLGMLADAGRAGVTKARRLALLEGAQQMAGLPQSPGVTRLPGGEQADPYKMAQLQLDANKFGLDQQRLGLDQNRLGLDQNKARQEAALNQQRQALDAHFKLPKDEQDMRMNQLQGAYYNAAMKSGPESPEAKKLATIINLIHGTRPALDLTALMQQQK